MQPPKSPDRTRGTVLAALIPLYVAQGIPFGFASEYLPVVLREAHVSLTAIASLAWLQLPWQLKIFWSPLADHPRARRHSRLLLLTLELGLALSVLLFAPYPLLQHRALWLGLTAIAALFAATQDVFVDAFAVRALEPGDRGWGNVAQVAGYRLGLLGGGAGLLLLAGTIGEERTFVACAAVIALAGVGAYFARDTTPAEATDDRATDRAGLWAIVRHISHRRTWPVLALALTFKLGMHFVSVVLKPMCVDAGWTKVQIGWAVVTVGTASGLFGAATGGALHRHFGERRAIGAAAVAQTLACLPLFVAALQGAPHGLTTVSIAVEHFASGLGTTVLFAALMSATRPADAGLHYTILCGVNGLSFGVGGMIAGAIGDTLGTPAVFVAAALASAAPLLLVPRWEDAARASAGPTEQRS